MSGPMPLSSRKGPADVAASRREIEKREKEEEQSKRRMKGRSLELPLGLSWAPNRMRESTIMMPFGLGVGRKVRGDEVIF